MENGKITDKPRKSYELAEYYEVDLRTFKSWLELSPELSAIKNKKKGHYFSVKEVRAIVEHLGEN